jgi:hypothetical protein
MDLSKILSISGKPGLFKLVGESKNNVIVESLIDGKRFPAFSHDRISSLHEISLYTESEDTPLEEVFKNIYEEADGKPAPDPKKSSSAEIRAFFEKILPDYDREAVYVSDMKKVFMWYNFLLEKEMLEFPEDDAETDQQLAEPEVSEEQLEQPDKKEEPED